MALSKMKITGRINSEQNIRFCIAIHQKKILTYMFCLCAHIQIELRLVLQLTLVVDLRKKKSKKPLIFSKLNPA